MVVRPSAGQRCLMVVSDVVAAALVIAKVVHSLMWVLMKLMMLLLLLLLLHVVANQREPCGGVGELVAVTRVVIGARGIW